MPPSVCDFLLGMVGSLGAALSPVLLRLQAGGRLPAFFTNKWYWCIRLIFVIIAGALAIPFAAECEAAARL